MLNSFVSGVHNTDFIQIRFYNGFRRVHRRRQRGDWGGGGGATYPLPPPNNPHSFSFTFYVEQENITNVPS